MNESLKRHTSIKIGGRAKFFIRAYTQEGLLNLMRLLKEKRMPYFIIGAGTNVLFPDRGYRGVIIQLRGVFQRIENHNGLFIAGAGVKLKDLLKRAMEKDYGGAEFLTGIPGTVGGAIKGNAGAFGNSISEITKGVVLLDKNLKIKYKDKTELKFGYRKSEIGEGEIILYGELKFSKKEKKRIARKMAEFLKRRRERQPWGYSAGSFFKNPLPFTAGSLIDECGLKGKRIGDAMVSKKHANFIINLGRAKSADVLRLVRLIQKRVKEKRGIELEPEVRIVC